MRVIANHVYVFHANMLDRIDSRTSLRDGAEVRVVRLPGCPRPNVMGHCHIADPETGDFLGLVHTNSLHSREDYVAYLRNQIAALDSRREADSQ